VDSNRWKDLVEIAEAKDDVCDAADEWAMIEIELQGLYINPERNQRAFELWEGVWQESHRPWSTAAEFPDYKEAPRTVIDLSA